LAAAAKSQFDPTREHPRPKGWIRDALTRPALRRWDLVESMDHLSLAGRARVRRSLRKWTEEHPQELTWLRQLLGRTMVRPRRRRLLRPGYVRSTTPR
jgi:hypothetical protein